MHALLMASPPILSDTHPRRFAAPVDSQLFQHFADIVAAIEYG
jgi:hypothetical protein